MKSLLIVLGLVLGASPAFAQLADTPACKAAKAARREAKQKLDTCLANYVQQRCGGGACLISGEEYAAACPGKRQKLRDAITVVGTTCTGESGLEPAP